MSCDSIPETASERRTRIYSFPGSMQWSIRYIYHYQVFLGQLSCSLPILAVADSNPSSLYFYLHTYLWDIRLAGHGRCKRLSKAIPTFLLTATRFCKMALTSGCWSWPALKCARKAFCSSARPRYGLGAAREGYNWNSREIYPFP